MRLIHFVLPLAVLVSGGFLPSHAFAQPISAMLVANIDFEARDARDSSGFRNDGTVFGDPDFERGYDGGTAIRLMNSFGKMATQYVDFGGAPSLRLGLGNFSFAFWYRTRFGGAPSWDVEPVEAGLLTNFSQLRKGSGVILANKDFAMPYSKGFAVSDTPNSAYLTVNFVGRDTDWKAKNGPVSQLAGIWQATDDRWHQIIMVVEREACLAVYVDGIRRGVMDLARHAGADIDAGSPLVLGADGKHQYGLGNALVDEFRMFSGALTPAEIARLYGRESLKALVAEVLERLDSEIPGKPYDAASIASVREEAERALSFADAASEQPGSELELRRDHLRGAFEALLLSGKPNLEMLLTSDTHVEARNREYSALLRKALLDPRAGGYHLDGAVITGDLTNIADGDNMSEFFDVLDSCGADCGDLRFLAITGNHDVRPKWGGDYTSSMDIYLQRNAKYVGDTNQVPYFTVNIEGYDFIGMNSDDSSDELDVDLRAHYDEAQLAWLRATLDRIDAKGGSKGVFFLSHQPFLRTCFGSNDGNSIGPQETAVMEMLASRGQTVAFNGHIHNGLGCASLDKVSGALWQLNLPSIKGRNRGYAAFGTVYIMRAFDDVIVFRARDTINGIWLPAYDFALYR